MSYLIIDKTINEIIGLFKSNQEAELYYLKNNIIERLKIYRHKLLNYSVDNVDKLWELRGIETLMENIVEFDETTSENTYTYIQGYINRAIGLLSNESALKICYVVQKFDEHNIRKLVL